MPQAAVTACLGKLASADDANWIPMTGDDIRTALTGHVRHYDGAWQDFRASGRTRYNVGRDSRGYWRIEGDRNCSQWPPPDLWACYKMDRRGNVLRFIGDGADVTEGWLDR